MTVFYQLFSSENRGSGATILFPEGPVPIDSSHPNWNAIKESLTGDPQGTVEEIRALVTPGESVSQRLRNLSERVAWNGHDVLFDGDPVHNAITSHIVRILESDNEDNSYAALVAFLEKLAQNPSEKSRNSLYEFIVRHEITIDNDGDFYVYKGVNADGSSRSAGYGIVDGVVIEHGNLMNSIGSVLEIPRSRVDADTSVGCSTGLHAGSYAYASAFSRGKLLTVKVNPRDVVSVPDHLSFQKIRVSRYKVTGVAEHQITAPTFSYGEDDVDLNTITELENILEDYDEVDVEFTYRNGNGGTSRVFATITGTLVNQNQQLVLLGSRDELSDSWLYEHITDFTIDSDLLDDVYGYDRTEDEESEEDAEEDAGWTGPDVAELDSNRDNDSFSNTIPSWAEAELAANAVVEVDAETRLRELVDNGAEVYINFDYLKVNNETRRLEGFLAQEIRATNTHGQDLISGIRAEDEEERVYRMDRMSNITFVSAAETLIPETAEPAVSAVDVAEAVVRAVEAGHVTTVSFDYTSAQGNTRRVERAVITAIRPSRETGERILVGRRPGDSVEKTYRLDRTSNMVLV